MWGFTMKKDKNRIFLPLVFLFYNAAYCLYFGFIVSYLSHMGYQSDFIGVVMTLCALINMVTQPIFGYISETYVPVKYIMLGISALSVPVGFVLPWTVSVPFMALSSVVLLSVLEYPGFPLIDMWGVRLQEKTGGISYGVVRSCGSFGYAAAALIFGKIFDRIGIENMFIVHAVLLIVTVLVIFPTSAVACENKKAKEGEKRISMPKAFALLSKNRKYMMFLTGYMFINTGMRFMTSFYPILIEVNNGTVGQMGTGIFLMALSEIPFVLGFVKYSKKIRVDLIMLFALSMFTVRNLSMYFAPNVFWLQAAQLTQGISYGVYIPTVLYYMSTITPRKITTTALTISNSCVGAVSAVAGNLLGGFMIANVGIYPSILFCAALSFVGAVIFFISLFVPKTVYENM